MRTANPALRQFVQPQTWDRLTAAEESKTMTVAGTAIKTGILLAICVSVAVFAWQWAKTANSVSAIGAPLTVTILAGIILGLIIAFKPAAAVVLGPIYAVSEGVFIGIASWLIPHQFKVGEAVIGQAAGLTFGILLVLLIAYASGLVRLGSTATKVLIVATGGVAAYYLGVFTLNLLGFGVHSIGYDTSPMGIGFSALVVILASLNLVLDFQFIEAGVMRKAPKHMEWYGAVGLMVTIVWLYFETLRLLAKMRD
jgi:uncharacterized YccA/Bax inhibitor family protein